MRSPDRKKSRISSPKAAAAPPATLPEDAVLEILARVPDVADLFRCAAACKRWRELLADRLFLRRRWPEGARHRSSLIGFFGQEWYGEDVADFLCAPRSVLHPGRPFLGSFVPGAAKLFDHAVPLASNRGLLLVRYVPHGAPRDDGKEPSFDRLAVCNLHSGTCDVLPPLKCGWFVNYLDRSGYAIITGADCLPCPHPPCSSAEKPFFKVLVIGINQDDDMYSLRTFSFGEDSWSPPSKCFDPIEHQIFGAIVQRNAVVRRGTVHWLIWDMVNFHSLNMNAITGRVSSHMLPTPRPEDLVHYHYDNPRLGVAADRTTLSSLCFFKEHLKVETSIWRDDGDEGETDHWQKDGVVELQRPTEKQINVPSCMCIGEMSGTMLIRADHERIYMADLESGVLEEVPDKFCRLGGWKAAFAIEIDWPALFMQRLGRKIV